MREGNNKRLLLLKNLLFDQTDEANVLNVYQIKAELQKETNQIKLDIRTIKQDMESLQEIDLISLRIVERTVKYIIAIKRNFLKLIKYVC